jgi:hypothetical protein
MAAFQSYLESGKRGKEKWVGMRVMLLLVKKTPCLKRKCETVRCHATASSFVAKVRGEVFADFHAVSIKRHSGMWN